MFGYDGICFSNHDSGFNNKQVIQNMRLQIGDIIYIKVDIYNSVISFGLNSGQNIIVEMNIRRRKKNHDGYYGCVYLGGRGESV